MKFNRALMLGAILLLGVGAWGQEFPRAEVGFNYSYARYAPSSSYSKGHSLNGGGGSWQGQPKEGDRFPMTLTFEKAGEVKVDVVVEGVKAAPMADMKH